MGTRLCDPHTFGLSQQIPVPLAGDLEMNGWMQDHVDPPSRSCRYV